MFNTVAHVEGRLDDVKSGWREFVDDTSLPSPRMLGIEDQLTLHPVPEATHAAIEKEGLEDLLNRRAMVVQELSDIAASLVEEMSTEAAEEEKARQRRFDSGPAIKVWLEMLAENGWLEGNLKRFM
jgi:ubiquitin carboxyl-terminal hydrolase L5